MQLTAPSLCVCVFVVYLVFHLSNAMILIKGVGLNTNKFLCLLICAIFSEK